MRRPEGVGWDCVILFKKEGLDCTKNPNLKCCLANLVDRLGRWRGLTRSRRLRKPHENW